MKRCPSREMEKKRRPSRLNSYRQQSIVDSHTSPLYDVGVRSSIRRWHMAKQYSISYACENLGAIVKEMEEGEPVELTEKGEPVAVLVSAEDYKWFKRYSPHRPKPKSDFGAALREFQAMLKRENINLDDVYDNIRDKSPDGR